MKKLNKIQVFVYGLGAVLVLVGVVMIVTPLYSFSPYIYGVGAICFSSMQMLARYEGQRFIVRRLRRQQLIGAFILLLTVVPLYMHVYQVGFARHNEWVLCLSVAAWLELYTAFRLSAELEREVEDKL